MTEIEDVDIIYSKFVAPDHLHTENTIFFPTGREEDRPCNSFASYPSKPMHPMRDLRETMPETYGLRVVNAGGVNGVDYISDLYANNHLGGGYPVSSDIYFGDTMDDPIERSRSLYTR
jgi:hypothetical protein